jgi:hypothetical protein
MRYDVIVEPDHDHSDDGVKIRIKEFLGGRVNAIREFLEARSEGYKTHKERQLGVLPFWYLPVYLSHRAVTQEEIEKVLGDFADCQVVPRQQSPE